MKLGEYYKNRAFPKEKESPTLKLNLVEFQLEGSGAEFPGCCPSQG